jgi:hypothetical protein
MPRTHRYIMLIINMKYYEKKKKCVPSRLLVHPNPNKPGEETALYFVHWLSQVNQNRHIGDTLYILLYLFVVFVDACYIAMHDEQQQNYTIHNHTTDTLAGFNLSC